MATISPAFRALALEPTEESVRGNGADDTAAGVAATSRPPEIAVSRESEAMFLATATQEYESGWIDRPLWESVLAQSKGDESLAKSAYIRTRATILQLEKRGQATGAPAMRADAARQSAPEPAAPSVGTAHRAAPASSPAARRLPRSKLTPRALALATPALVAVLAIGIWLMTRGDGADGVSPTGVPAATAHRAQPAAAARTTPAAPAVDANSASIEEALPARIAKLRNVGNWNVMVLLASEWTRREPANAQAWIQLSFGYAQLHQFGDAIEAATKATQLAQTDPAAWRNLGAVQLEADRRTEALPAFEQAATLDANDVQTLLRVGMLKAQLARLPEAKAAFDKVLAGNPDNADAQCGLAFVARQQGLSKDADAITKNLQALGRQCQEWSAQGSADTAVSHPAAYRRVPTAAR
jgi:tetratricopeptide (TPR) repeat protein